MLIRLTVCNMAVVEKAEAGFSGGLNVVTGETGAGKSVLVGALCFAMGSRGDASMVREGAREARVEAVFDIGGDGGAVAEALAAAGLPECEDGMLVVRRTMSAAGSGRAWINDASATVATLRRVGASLVDFHGPSANLRLADESFQLSSLDGSGGVDREAYSARWEELSRIRAEIARLEDETGGDAEIDALRFQTAELEEAALSPEDEDLPARHAAQAHAGELAECSSEAIDALEGDGGAADALSRVLPRLSALSRHFPEAAEWAGEIEEISTRISELARTMSDQASRIESDPAELERLDARMGLVNRLKRKYLKCDRPGSVAGLMELAKEKRLRLEALEGRGERLEALRREEREALALVVAEGAALSRKRREAAARLSAAVERGLRDLGFSKASFGIALEPAEPSATGCDRAVFMFEPNPGEGARPLAETASSGETARVMLAVKGVLAEGRDGATLVFDEIDANVGGETGKAVGAKMKALSSRRQTIAITHLPQTAVFADTHIVVEKSVSGGRTRSSVRTVEGESRVAEIERMLGGEGVSRAARNHAEDLIAQAARFRAPGISRTKGTKNAKGQV